MFVGMETDLLLWKEKLSTLRKGSSLPVDNAQSVYSAIRTNPDLFKNKKFSVRATGVLPNLKKRVIRIK